MLVTIVVTVGISMKTNDRQRFGAFSERLKNRWTRPEWDLDRAQMAEEFIDGREFIGTESAELQTLIAMFAKNYSDNAIVLDLRLIASDSYESEFCAEIVGKVLSMKFGEKIKYKIMGVAGLNVNNYEEFRHMGMNNLVKTLIGINKEKSVGHVVYCISGGFKGVIPVMTILAQLFDVKCFYNYEKTDALIEIPVFPFDFDWKEWDEKYHKINEPDKLTETEKYDLMEAGLLDKEGEITVFGSVMKVAAAEKTAGQAGK